MRAYLLLIVALGLIYLIYPRRYRKDELSFSGARCRSDGLYLAVCCAVLIVFAGLRGHTVGADTALYLDALNYYASFDKGSILSAEMIYPYDFEPGYFLFTKLCAFFGIGQTAFLFIVAVLIYLPLFVFLRGRSSNPFLSICIYFAFFYCYSLGIFRQMIAMSMVLVALMLAERRNPIGFLLVVLFAATFHTTALIALPFYFLHRVNPGKLVYFVFPAIGFFLIFGRFFAELAVELFPRYENYLDVLGGSQGLSGYLMQLFYVGILILCLPYAKKIKGDFRRTVAVNAVIIASLLQAVSYSFIILGRATPYYSIFLLFLVPDLIAFYTRGKAKLLLSLAAYAFFIAYFYVSTVGEPLLNPFYFA